MLSSLKFARTADLVLGFVFLIAAGYAFSTGSTSWAALWAASSILSFASAKLMPARWLMTKLLRSKLKK